MKATEAPTSKAASALERARADLLEARVPAGHWEGELSPSALSTATAVTALEIVRRNAGGNRADLVRAGLAWLAAHQNADGGFGDTPDSPANVSTTALCWAALGLGPGHPEAFARAATWLTKIVGALDAPSLAAAIAGRYGRDRTFSAPILTMCALAGRFGEGREAWSSVPHLPFELSILPRSWFGLLNLQVVSYALPALIAIGQARHALAPSRNPFARMLRRSTRARTLRLLESIQPASGGFLEAAPLTSFVAMGLAAAGEASHPVTRKAVEFLAASARPDGSWAIDTNLATWVTTLAVGALPAEARPPVRDWLLRQQTKVEHPYTRSAPGGWAWTDRSGGVPDADDTAGALLALYRLREGEDPEARRAAHAGIEWLLGLQNRDGGIPTFCRGWGKLPFDRSCPDLTSHAIRAWSAWQPELDEPLRRRVEMAVGRAFDHLLRDQHREGYWVPLWFGNQKAADQSNPVYGTSRVLLCAELSPIREPWAKAASWLRSVQGPDGGFGSIEETALAVEGLAGRTDSAEAVARGCRWLAERTRFEPSPIGLYFAKLWYSERLYPLIFTVAALGRALR